MRTFFHRHSEDLQVMANLRGSSDREGLLKMRALIDRMRSQNLRQAALAMWQEKSNAIGGRSECPVASAGSAFQEGVDKIALAVDAGHPGSRPCGVHGVFSGM